MRFSNLILSMLFFLASCTSGYIYQPDLEEEQPVTQVQQTQPVGQAQQQPSVAQNQSEELVSSYGVHYDKLLDNVRIKQSDAFGITYEYKDVRIDEIAYLAAQYCYEQNGKRAYLYDSQLYKNYARRATFHCLELQN